MKRETVVSVGKKKEKNYALSKKTNETKICSDDNKQKDITLIALVVTIVVLIILALVFHIAVIGESAMTKTMNLIQIGI